MTKYVLELNWQAKEYDFDISFQDVLRHSGLPQDLFTRNPPMITASEFFSLWVGIEYVFKDDPIFPIHLAQQISPETFSPPMFAALCSKNLSAAYRRLAKYKPLVGPLSLYVTEDDEQLLTELRGIPGYEALPSTMVMAELLFLVRMAQIGTREPIKPRGIMIAAPLREKERYEDFLGCRIRESHFNGISFAASDAYRPFLTANDAMWSIFEKELNQRLQNLTNEADFRDRVRACLIEILASGEFSMSDVASRLAISTRTLQRRLRQENTTFQRELDHLREELARHYLGNSTYTSNQIAFLLGYEEPTSFFRAFRTWTGQTPERARDSMVN